MRQAESFTERSLTPNVSGFLHRPAGPLRDALILTHGAGSNCQTTLLLSLAEVFATAGFLVLRCDLPFRQNSPHGPPSPSGAERDREGLRCAVTAIRNLVPGQIFLGGHSYGGRQASLLAASAPGLVDGLLLLAYPLHPPRKPQELRVQHFPNMQTPALFVHGTRDPFGLEEELSKAVTLIPARTDLFFVEGAGHELKAGKKEGSNRERSLAERVRGRFTNFSTKP